MTVYEAILGLVDYGLREQLIEGEDRVVVTNALLETLSLDGIPDSTVAPRPTSLWELLDVLVKDAHARGLIPSDQPPYSDLYDTKIMGLLTPRQSTVNRRFWREHADLPEKATDDFYALSRATGYIRTNRTSKNRHWKVPSPYGEIEITINLSKPEKDPKAIAAARKQKSSGYPKCVLCMENAGYAGTLNHPARQNHRLVSLSLADEPWYLQYSPYVYYNEHCIVLKEKHEPMKINETTFERLLDFVDLFPHYFVGSNADLPIVGGSLLSHDHFQGGRHVFAMERAQSLRSYKIPGFEDVRVSHLKWPLTVLRLKGADRMSLVNLAERIRGSWALYSDPGAHVLANTGAEKHHTITPICRRREDGYELDIVLRDNHTSDAYPDGVFHPHPEVHPVKKENIGLIEVMGLAVLPPRLVPVMTSLEEAYGRGVTVEALGKEEQLADFRGVYDRMRRIKGDIDAGERVRRAIGELFIKGLEDAGVYKQTTEGVKALERFIATL